MEKSFVIENPWLAFLEVIVLFMGVTVWCFCFLTFLCIPQMDLSKFSLLVLLNLFCVLKKNFFSCITILYYLKESTTNKWWILLPFECNFILIKFRYYINKQEVDKSCGGEWNCYLFVIHDIFHSVFFYFISCQIKLIFYNILSHVVLLDEDSANQQLFELASPSFLFKNIHLR